MSQEHLNIVIYFFAFAIYGIIEVTLQRKYSNWKSAKTDKSFAFLLVPFYMSVYLAPLEYVLLKPETLPVSIVIGYLVLLTGVFLRFIAFRTLGKNFSVAVESKPGSTLVDKGIYKYIRHPLYLATLIISLPGCIIFNCLFSWIFVILTLTSIIFRINKEEAFLSESFPQYGEYRKGSYKLIPFVY